MSARFFLGLGAIAALPITWGLFITADHADLPFGTPGSNAVQSRFQHFQTHAFDTSRRPQRVPRSERYNSGEKGSLHSQLDHSASHHADDAEQQHPSSQAAGGKWSHVRDGLRREAPRGNLGGAADPGMSLAEVMAERERQV
ncbi:hypothetical protein KC343_g3513 [Hortaea werneckii]|uniref:Uncharacterized protein n=1 Tax=Hortaea werneckii TaxID=91943 RepID=A0A3M7DVE0_HORWE|nr:hypothetical protein KC338_g5747 [Hortaea werneckii]KAI6866009.1 hypothetical protein KC323_g4129 [Hortaea werneckii]KAI7278216.1 hypothetical protein KC352_g7521 [Hortaea werneckii]KAI7349937.1 hypothetical protein KC320_g5799 [Hortaea werneckii]KAI7568445.1 hypothetical protein KC317_g4186 [Hortaea werneckii]